MEMREWADNEVKIACERERNGKPENEWDYGCACYESALKAFNSLCEDGHSGASFEITKAILNRLMDHRPLTPIEDVNDVWNLVSEQNGNKIYQCKRMSSLFKEVTPDGKSNYSETNRCICIDINNPNSRFSNGLARKILDEMFPIEMPYFPSGTIKIYREDFLAYEDGGDFDTIGILYFRMPDGEMVEVKRYFKEDVDCNWAEITLREYIARKEKAEALKKKKEKRGDHTNGES